MSDAAHWENRYQTGDIPWDTGLPSRELRRVIAEVPIVPCRAIDMGCGTGANAVWLARKGFEVTAVDISPLAIRRARERAAAEGVNIDFVVDDVLDPKSLSDGYEFLFDRGCYHVVRRVDVSRYLRTLEKVTRPGTVALVLTGNAREPHDPGPPVVAESEIRAELGGLFEMVQLREFYFDQPASAEKFLAWSCLLKRKAL